ncbi:MAG: hypothetical protein LBJ59_12210, partial [Zoogloeaceae bacterium]|nr:hypothetical protein [Zoogloeaceae bacterium]
MNNEFDDAVAATLNPDHQAAQDARIGFSVAVDTHPDAYAEARRVARRTGVPVDTVLALPKEMKRQDAVGAIDFDTLAKTSPATVALLADMEKAKLAHDDVENLSGIEKTIKVAGNAASAFGSFVHALNEGAAGGAQWLTETAAPLLDPLTGRILPENPLRRAAEGWTKIRQRSEAASDAMMPKSDSLAESAIYSGLQSMGVSLSMLPLVIASGGTAAPMLAGMGIMTGGQSYGNARDKGKGVLPSLVFGASQGLIEAGTEMIGLPALLSLLKPGGAVKKGLEYLIKEQGGEQVATHLQELNDWAMTPDQSFGEYLVERPESALSTAIATAVAGGGQVTIMKGLEVLSRKNGVQII